MPHAHLPFSVYPSPTAARVLGADIGKIAVLALRTALMRTRSLEIAHLQIVCRTIDGIDHHVVFSTRIGPTGSIAMEIDLGDPGLQDYIVLERELRRAENASRTATASAKSSRRRQARIR